MIFSLEALEAKEGDALILHYGTADDPKFLVIDGGPAGVFKGSLQPRLEEIKEAVSPDEPLPLRMVMVSHLDADHITGILELTNKLLDQREEDVPLSYDVSTFWHNSFDDLLGNEDDELTASVQSAAAAAAASTDSGLGGAISGGGKKAKPGDKKLHVHHDTALVLASVGQGRKLRDAVLALAADANEGFNGLVMVHDGEKSEEIDLGDGLTFTVVGPLEEQVVALQEEWNKQLKKQGLLRAAEFIDESVFNLSSIVVVAECGKKRMLLTGDARGDFVLLGLERAGYMKQGKCHLDLLKVPHHGSDRNMSTEFFRRVTADHYVFSGDGKHGNPEKATFQMLVDARGQAKYTIYLTNDLPKASVKFLKDQQASHKYKLVIRDKDFYSTWVDLGDEKSKF